MNKLAAIEMQKVVMWALAVLVALAIIGFMYAQLAPGTEGSLTNETIGQILKIR
jgi:hypothetical protein